MKELGRLGVTTIQFEDQKIPKRCGHFSGKEVIEKEEMVEKIRHLDALITLEERNRLTGLDQIAEWERRCGGSG